MTDKVREAAERIFRLHGKLVRRELSFRVSAIEAELRALVDEERRKTWDRAIKAAWKRAASSGACPSSMPYREEVDHGG